MPDISVGRGATTLGLALKLPFIPITRVENFCATGSEALRGAVYGVASGAYDICLALGMEKLKDCGYGGLPLAGGLGYKAPLSMFNMTAPGGFAMMATKYFSQYKLSPQDGKMMLAKVSAKSHRNGALNPKAHLRKEVTVEQIVNAPIIAWPLGLFDCCGVSDGAAAAIVCRADMAKKFRQDPVLVKSMQISVSSGEEMFYTKWDGSHVERHRAGIMAYKGGIKNPREEVSMAEVHDCFSITELPPWKTCSSAPGERSKTISTPGAIISTARSPYRSTAASSALAIPSAPAS
jgi:acetyl-CoA C-acetyltransferase